MIAIGGALAIESVSAAATITDGEPGIGFYFSDGSYYGECGWLKRRAIETDSPIWWHRYRRCREFG